jgi:hypothetical protein
MPCVADDDGRTCYREPVMTAPVQLCGFHRVQVALAIVPDLLRVQLVSAADGPAAAPEPRVELVGAARSVPIAPLLGSSHASVVYFIANGSRVKIGFTTNLKNRLGSLALRADSVLLALDGGPDLERALHAQFSDYRNGDTEWFELAPEIVRYVSAREEALSARRSQGQRMAEAGGQLRNAAPPFPRLLIHLRDVWPAGAKAMHSHRVVEALAALRPEEYAPWMETAKPLERMSTSEVREVQAARSTALSAALKAHGVHTSQITIRDCCGGAKGVRETDLATAKQR